jgi:hypothetical protein
VVVPWQVRSERGAHLNQKAPASARFAPDPTLSEASRKLRPSVSNLEAGAAISFTGARATSRNETKRGGVPQIALWNGDGDGGRRPLSLLLTPLEQPAKGHVKQ